MTLSATRERRRSDGGGRKTPYAVLEQQLLDWVIEQRARKFMVTYNSLRAKALAIKVQLGNCEEFRASPSWLRGFLARNHLSYRTPTHVAQQNTKTPELKCKIILNFLNKLNMLSTRYDLRSIYNMDESPFYFDKIAKRTIDIVGSKSIDVNTSGNDKNRFTVTVTISADGTLYPFYVILRGLKEIP
jgi:hypothetical protein